MKFATFVLAYNQDKWIMRNIENAYPHVDKIYVGYSHYPWNYNPASRYSKLNSFNIDILKNSPYYDKIQIVEGNWEHEYDERNEILNIVKQDGFDYLMIHDADEFYFHEDFEKLKSIIRNNPEYDAYCVKLLTFWKSFNYVLISPEVWSDGAKLEGPISGMAEVVMNLKSDHKFTHIRYSGAQKYLIINEKDLVYYHGSYVLSNEELYRKIKTWAHTVNFDTDKWFNEKWLNWTPETINLHPIWPHAWTRAEKYTGKLPEVISDLR